MTLCFERLEEDVRTRTSDIQYPVPVVCVLKSTKHHGLWTYQIHVFIFNKPSKDFNLGSQNAISKPEFDALTNGKLLLRH